MAVIVTGLGFGDEGKGTTVDLLTRQLVKEGHRPTIVRYNGGAQAEHNVVTFEGRHHTFAQVGSGSFMSTVRTFLSRYMIFNPSNFVREIGHLELIGTKVEKNRMFISEDAPIIAPWHIVANQRREYARGKKRHGSTGQGIGEVACHIQTAPESVLRVRDLFSSSPLAALKASFEFTRNTLRADLDPEVIVQFDQAVARRSGASGIVWGRIEQAMREPFVFNFAEIVTNDFLAELSADGPLIFEGAQGILLDERFGFQPHTTWSATTAKNALTLLGEIGYTDKITKLGVIRAYMTRHGNGPFVTEDSTLAEIVPEPHNGFGDWTGHFRYGHLDLVAHKYAVMANSGVDQVAVTCLDRLNRWNVCNRYNVPAYADVDQYFRLQDDQAVEIRLGDTNMGRFELRDRQTRLTELLFSCQPIYHPVRDGRTLIREIEQALCAPVRILSYGMTADDKVIR